MKPLAKRLAQIKPSPTLALNAKAQELKTQGHDVISLATGEPDFNTPSVVITAGILAMQTGQTRYTPTSGTLTLKKAIQHKLNRDNSLDYALNEIVVTNGGKQALYNLAMVLFEAGDEVLIPTPYWVSYPEQVLLCGATPVFIQTTAALNFKITPELLNQSLTKKTKALILNSPSNPSGMGYTKIELEALATICVQNKIYIIADEIYEHIVYDDFQHVSIASLNPEIKALTITINGASKAFAMTGWRMGFAAGPKNIIEAMTCVQDQSTSNICSITQAAAETAFLNTPVELTSMVNEFRIRRNLMVKALNEIEGISCLNPVGAFYLFLNIKKLFGKKTPEGSAIRSASDFCDYVLKSHNLVIVPGSCFGQEGYVRLSFATTIEVLKIASDRLKTAVTALI